MLNLKRTLWITGIFVLVLLASLFIPKNTEPPEDTRIILDHTYETYIAPPCFDQADATNFLEETDLKTAAELNYAAHDQCTEASLQTEQDSLLIGLMKSIGIIHTKWDEW